MPLKTLAQQNEALLHAYYKILQKNPAFTADLLALHARLRMTVQFPGPSSDLLEFDEIDASGLEAISDFAKKWHLPTERGVDDVLWAMRLAQRTPQGEVRMALTVTQQFSGAGHGTGRHAVAMVRLRYDPTRDDHKQAARKIDKLLLKAGVALRRRLREIENEAGERGFQRVGPRHLSQSEVNRLARRVYEKAVLKRTYVEIAGNETLVVGPDAVGRSVASWSRRLGIPIR